MSLITFSHRNPQRPQLVALVAYKIPTHKKLRSCFKKQAPAARTNLLRDNACVLSRRGFLQSVTLSAAAATLPRRVLSATDTAPATRLDIFPYSAVTLAPGPLLTQMQQSQHLLLQLDDDSLLYPFRKMESLPTPGTSLAGWYAADGFAPGHAFGQWISALSHNYAATGDQQARAKVGRLIALHADTLRPDGKFFRDNHFPAYTYDKLLRGLMDAHTLAGDPLALPTMQRLSAIAAPTLPKAAISRNEMCALPQDPHQYCYDESYTLSENQFLAWKLTHDPRYLATGERLLNVRQFFDPLAQGQNALIKQHAYSHMNQLSSGAQAYLTLGEDKYLRAVTNGFRFVEQQSFATGGWGPNEEFVDPATDQLAQALASTHRGFETPCGSYAHLKLGRYLLSITEDPHYGDSMERVLYNTVMGAIPIQPDGHAFYYSDYNWGSTKTFFSERWPCCSGTLPLVATDYGISSYFRSPAGVTVNLYIPSTLNWTSSNGTRLALTQSGDYPFQPEVTFRISTSRPARFTFRFRIPAWAKGAELRVNSERAAAVTSGTFAELTREWQNNDHIELTLPLTMRTEQLNSQHPEIAALVRGPVCLFALTNQGDKILVTGEQLVAAAPTAASHREFHVEKDGGALKMIPFSSLVLDDRYSLYLRLRST